VATGTEAASGRSGVERNLKISELKQFEDKTVKLRTNDGEVAKVRVMFVDVEYEDIIGDVLETTNPNQYSDPKAVYTFRAADILSIEISE
jgi:hypothetical protein